MKRKEDIKPKGKTREKCGDCFYNGSCTLPLNECFFQIKERRKKAYKKELSFNSIPNTRYTTNDNSLLYFLNKTSSALMLCCVKSFPLVLNT